MIDAFAHSPSNTNFIIETNVGFNESMIDFAKMAILLAFSEYPTNDYKKCEMISIKFEERYGGEWGTSIVKDGDSCFVYHEFCITMIHQGYKIKINKTQ